MQGRWLLLPDAINTKARLFSNIMRRTAVIGARSSDNVLIYMGHFKEI